MLHITLCPKCNYSVSDPICVKCYLMELAIWLNEQKITLDQRAKLMRKIRKNLLYDNFSKQTCILCEKNAVSLCMYCFFFNVMYYLKVLNFSDETIESFQEHFNYEIYNIKGLH